MHKQLLFVSTLALSTSLLIGQGLGTARAQTVEALTPKGGWSINKIAADTDQGYCALSRKYSGDKVLTLGRNTMEEYSLAIDFMGEKLNPDKAYSVTLQPGPGQIRAYEMMPASLTAMVVRLGYDDSFFNALEQSGQLKAEIDGKKYEFSVPEFSKGKADLQNCMGGLKPAPAKPTTEVAKGFTAEKIEDAPPMKVAEANKTDKSKAKKSDEPTQAIAIKPVEKAPDAKVVEIKPKEMAAAVEPKTPRQPIEMSKEMMAPVKTAPEKTVSIDPPAAQKAAPKKIEMDKVASSISPQKNEVTPSTRPKIVSEKEVSVPPPVVTSAKNTMPIVKAPEVEIAKAESDSPVAPPTPVEEKIQVKPDAKKIEISREVTKVIVPQTIGSPETQTAKADVTVPDAPKIVSSMIEQPRTIIRSNNDALLNKSIVSREPNAPAKDIVRPIVQTNLQKKQIEALEKLKADNDKLNQALIAERAKPDVKSPDRTAEISKLQAEINALQTELEKARNVAPEVKVETVKVPNPIDEKIKADLAQLKLENEQLKSSMQALAAQKAEQQKQMAALAETATPAEPKVVEKIVEVPAPRSPEAEMELAKAQEQLKELEIQNRVLQIEAKKARGQIDTAVVETSNEALKKMRAYEKRLEAAAADNIALAKEVEELRRLQEDRAIGNVSGDVDLEQATRRYNEAEREIKRLGMLLEQQRLAHRQERAELETMLFDPAVTDKEQRRRLAELELQLEEAQKQLQASGKTLASTPRFTPRAPMEERVAINSIDSNPMPANPAPVVEQQLENLEMQRLSNQVARQNNQLKAYERAATQTKLSQMAPMTVTATPSAITAQAPRAPIAQVTASPVSNDPKQTNPSTAFGQDEIRQLLGQAGISGNVTKQSAGQYRWNMGSLVGQAQVVEANKAGNLDRFAQSFISRAKQSCGGDFASLPAPSSATVKSYEIACISPTRSTSSSVVFAQRGDELLAISHETSVDDMDAAMNARDRVAEKL